MSEDFLAALQGVDFYALTDSLFFAGEGGTLGSRKPPGSLVGVSYEQSGADSCLHLHWLNENSADHYWEPWLNQTGFGVQLALDLFSNDGELVHQWGPTVITNQKITDGEGLHRRMRELTVLLMRQVSEIENKTSETLSAIAFVNGVARTSFIGPNPVMTVSNEFKNTDPAQLRTWYERIKWLNDNSPCNWELWQNLEQHGIRIGLDVYDKEGALIHAWPARYITRSWLADGVRIYEAGTEALRIIIAEVNTINQNLSETPWLED